jgi:hypothetical protein
MQAQALGMHSKQCKTHSNKTAVKSAAIIIYINIRRKSLFDLAIDESITME